MAHPYGNVLKVLKPITLYWGAILYYFKAYEKVKEIKLKRTDQKKMCQNIRKETALFFYSSKNNSSICGIYSRVNVTLIKHTEVAFCSVITSVTSNTSKDQKETWKKKKQWCWCGMTQTWKRTAFNNPVYTSSINSSPGCIFSATLNASDRVLCIWHVAPCPH